MYVYYVTLHAARPDVHCLSFFFISSLMCHFFLLSSFAFDMPLENFQTFHSSVRESFFVIPATLQHIFVLEQYLSQRYGKKELFLHLMFCLHV